MSKSKTRLSLTHEAQAPVRAVARAGQAPAPRLIQRAAAGATRPVGGRDARPAAVRAEVNESADFVVAAVVPHGRTAASGHVELVAPSAAFAPPPGMTLAGFLRRDGSAVKFAGAAGGVHLGREQAQAEFGPLLGQAQSLLQTHSAAARPAAVHREADAASTPTGGAAGLHESLAGSSGVPLGRESRTALEASYGADLSAVRVHTDGAADQAAREVHANAFATGQDVYFRAGRYQPDSAAGKRLLAHEVAHTVQQSAGAAEVAAENAPGEMRISEPGDPLERAAENAAERAVRGEPANVRPSAGNAGDGLVSREAAPARPSPAPTKKTPTPAPKTKAAAPPPQPAAPLHKAAEKHADQGDKKKAPPTAIKAAPVPKAKGPEAQEAGPESSAAGADKAQPISRRGDAGLHQVIAKVHGAAAKYRTHPPPTHEVAAAQAAAKGPPNEVAGMAAGRQVATMDEQKPRPFDREKFLEALLKKIDEAAPQTLEEADDFKKKDKVGELKGSLTAQVDQSKGESQGPLEAATQAQPDSSGIEPKPVAELKPADAAAPAAEVPAAAAAPTPAPEPAVSLRAGPAALDQQMDAAGVTSDQLAKSNEPTFQKALTSKETAAAHAEQAPKAYREQERGALAGAKAENVAAVQKQLGEMAGVRGKALGQAHAHQGTAKAQDEQKRAEIVQAIQAIYDKTKQDVTDQLQKLDAVVNSAFDAGALQAQQAFENHVADAMDRYKQDRYSGAGGWALWLKDKAFSLPDEVNQFYVEGKVKYVEAMKGVMGAIASLVEAGLTAAKERIAAGKADVDKFVHQQPRDLQGVAQEAAANIQAQFAQLEQTVDDKQGQIIDGLVQRYQEKVKALDDQIAKMREENKGLIGAAEAALAGVLETIANLKAMLLGVLAKAGDAVSLIVKDPIGFLGNLAAGVKLGFLNFIGKIGTYLKKGLLDWLFGALAEAGLKLPDKFDLAGILSIVLQVLGLTYANIRSRAVKIVGEKVVKALETGAEIFITLMTKGVAGLWEWIKDKASALLDTVLDGIKSFVMDRVIMAGVTWVIGLLNPASAFVKACKAIYDIVMFFVERGQQIMALVNAVLDSVTAIAKGQIGAAAKFVEDSLAKSVPVLIGFLASLLGLGGVSEEIKKIIAKIQEPVNAMIDWVINKAVQLVKAAGKLLGFGREEKESNPNLQGVKGTAQTLLSERLSGEHTEEQAKEAVVDVKSKLQPQGLKSLELVKKTDSPGYDIFAEASPRDRVESLVPNLTNQSVAMDVTITFKDKISATQLVSPKMMHQRTEPGFDVSGSVVQPTGLLPLSLQDVTARSKGAPTKDFPATKTLGGVVIPSGSLDTDLPEGEGTNKVKILTWNTANIQGDSDFSHAERQFFTYLNELGDLKPRIVAIHIRITDSPCTAHCVGNVAELTDKLPNCNTFELEYQQMWPGDKITDATVFEEAMTAKGWKVTRGDKTLKKRDYILK